MMGAFSASDSASAKVDLPLPHGPSMVTSRRGFFGSWAIRVRIEAPHGGGLHPHQRNVHQDNFLIQIILSFLLDWIYKRH